MIFKTVKKVNNYYTKNLDNYKVTFTDGKIVNVPLDPANTHYQAIQEWVAEGNTIEEAD